MISKGKTSSLHLAENCHNNIEGNMYKNSLSEDLPIKSVLFVLEGGGSNMKLDFNASFLCSPLKGNIIDSRHQKVEI